MGSLLNSYYVLGALHLCQGVLLCPFNLVPFSLMVGKELSTLLYIKAMLREAVRISKRVWFPCTSSTQKASGVTEGETLDLARTQDRG